MADGSELEITVELVEAVDTVLGSELTPRDRTVLLLLSRYIDSLAKGYGLSEHRDVTTDPLVIAQRELPERAVDLIRHFLPESGANNADDIRERLYTVFVDVSRETRARGLVDDVLAL